MSDEERVSVAGVMAPIWSVADQLPAQEKTRIYDSSHSAVFHLGRLLMLESAARDLLRLRPGNEGDDGWVKFEGSDQEWDAIADGLWEQFAKALGRREPRNHERHVVTRLGASTHEDAAFYSWWYASHKRAPTEAERVMWVSGYIRGRVVANGGAGDVFEADRT